MTAIPENLAPDEWAVSVARAADGYKRDGSAITEKCLSEELCDLLGSRFPEDCYGMRELLTLEPIRQLATSPRVLSLAQAVLGERAFAVSATFFNKPPSANWKVPWHQDRMIKVKERFDFSGWGPWSTKDRVIHVQPTESVLSRMVAIRLHLDDCPRENGALRVIPGSHLLGILPPEAAAAAIAARPEEVCEVPKGGALLMSPLLLHCSSSSSLPRARRVIHIEFASDELPEPLEWRYRVT